MITSNRPLIPYAFLAGYALLLPFVHWYLSPVSSGFTGIFLVVAASLMGLKLGLAAAAYAFLLSLSLSGHTSASAEALLIEGLAYLVVSFGIGYVVEQYQQAQQVLKEDIAKRKVAEEQLTHIIYHDPLTGAHNRSYYEERMPELDKAGDLPLTIILGDVNGLKLINDTFGHHAGDKLLIRAASLMGQHCRPQDLFCRWGGDEFLIVMPATDKMTALQTIERINKACRLSDNEPIAISISLGVATKDKEFINIQDVMKEAEDRMYRAKLLESKNLRYTLVSSLQALMEEKTEETIGHSLRMQHHVLRIGQKLELSKSELDELSLLSALHDIGKLAIPDNIIMKLDALTPEEWDIMQRHSEIGYRIANSSPELSHIADKILYHHEWWNGTGYPQGLMAEEIPLLSRIVAIADSYDVMTHGRPYKQSLTSQEAAAELNRLTGTQYDPRLVALFLEVLAEAEASAPAPP